MYEKYQACLATPGDNGCDERQERRVSDDQYCVSGPHQLAGSFRDTEGKSEHVGNTGEKRASPPRAPHTTDPNAIQNFVRWCNDTARGVGWLAADDLNVIVRRQRFGDFRNEVSGGGELGAVQFRQHHHPVRHFLFDIATHSDYFPCSGSLRGLEIRAEMGFLCTEIVLRMRAVIQKMLGSLGYRVTRRIPPDASASELATIALVQPYTMSSVERILSAIRAAAYVVQNRVPGDVVECGVWKGGSSMAFAKSLLDAGDTSRSIFLYDTYEGMTPPTQVDVDWKNTPAVAGADEHWGYTQAGLAEVKNNLALVGYPPEKLVFVKGPVETTLPSQAPQSISLLRLDTDWFESTKHEMVHLYPRLSSGGVLIIDDYGHYAGARRAVDEYFAERGIHPYMHRVDYTARVVVKP